MARLRGGQAVARAMHAEGIDTVFGIVGTHNSLIFDGLTDLSDLRVVTTRHEGGAGFMADGFARATGRPAACIVVPGPGLTNLMTALGQAYLDSVPVLAIAGQNPIPTLGPPTRRVPRAARLAADRRVRDRQRDPPRPARPMRRPRSARPSG